MVVGAELRTGLFPSPSPIAISLKSNINGDPQGRFLQETESDGKQIRFSVEAQRATQDSNRLTLGANLWVDKEIVRSVTLSFNQENELVFPVTEIAYDLPGCKRVVGRIWPIK